uniref:Uncharacterized protein n=1 Tax=viral metagenome TaxID=1070528 RepID=A0A6C0IC17_9ZZZZ
MGGPFLTSPVALPPSKLVVKRLKAPCLTLKVALQPEEFGQRAESLQSLEASTASR